MLGSVKYNLVFSTMTSAFSIERVNKKLQIRRLEIYAAILLSIAALGKSWSGYQSARWIGVKTTDYRQFIFPIN